MPRKDESGFVGLMLIIFSSLAVILLISGGAFFLFKSQSAKNVPISSSPAPKQISQEKMLFVDFLKEKDSDLLPGKAVFFTYNPENKERKELFNIKNSVLELFEAGISPDKKIIYWISHSSPLMGSSFSPEPGAYSPKLYVYDQTQGVREIKVSDDPIWELNISSVSFNADNEFYPCHFFKDSKRMACLLIGRDGVGGAATGKAKIISVDTQSKEVQTIYELGSQCPELPKVEIQVEDFGTGNLDSIKSISTPDQPCYESSGLAWIYLEGWGEDNKLILRNDPGGTGKRTYYTLDPNTSKIGPVNITAVKDTNHFIRPIYAEVSISGVNYKIHENSSDNLSYIMSITNTQTQEVDSVKGIFAGVVNF